MIALQPKFFRCDTNFNSFRGLDDSRRGSSICSLSILGFACLLLPSTSGFRNSSRSARLNYVAFAKRIFSTNVLLNESMFIYNGKMGRISTKHTVSIVHEKRVQEIATQGIGGNSKITFPMKVARKNILGLPVSARKNINGINSFEVLPKDEQKEANSSQSISAPSSVEKKVSKTKTKQKPRSRTKKKEEPSGTLSSPDDSSKGSSKVKRLNGLSPEAAEVSSFFLAQLVKIVLGKVLD